MPSDARASGAPSGSVAVEDPSLLEALPATVAGQPVTLESIAFEEALGDPAFASNVESAALAVVVSGEDLASAVVARPNEGVFTDAWFRDWRDSYDRGACSQAGGVAATTETEVDGRTLYVGTCAGGLHTYHMWLPRRQALVSAFGVGENRFGEQLMAGIRP